MGNIKNRIVFICTANTCRSPMAEALFRHALAAQAEPLNQIEVASAGVSAMPGQPANVNTIAALKKVGVEIGAHQSKMLSQELVERAFAFVGMTESHLAMLSLQLDPPPENAFLRRQFIEGDPEPQIPDPFGLSLDYYEACRDSMVEAIPSLLKAIASLYRTQQ